MAEAQVMTAVAPPPPMTEADWVRLKPVIEMEYLTNNKSAEVVQRLLETQYDAGTTVRKLKLKFDAWKWDKKITADNYLAMNRVIQDAGQHIVFIVPKMGGRVFCRVEARKALKESNRKRANNERLGRPPPPTLDLQVAYNMLREAGIRIEHQHTAHTQQPLAPSGSQVSPSWQTTLERPQQYRIDRTNNDGDDDDDDSTVSDESMPDADMVEDSSRELNQQNFPPGLRFEHLNVTLCGMEDMDQRRMTAVLPFAAAYLADLHRNIFPCIPEYKLASPSVVIARNPEANAVLDPEFIPYDYTDYLGLNSSPELPASQRLFREKLIEQTLIEYYQRYDNDGHRKLVLEFSAYYVGQVLAGHESLDDYNHVDRRDARNRLRAMLEHNNMQLLPHCYWVSIIMMSYDKIRQLLAFLEDCMECIETSTSYLGSVLRPWIRFMIFNNREYYGPFTAELTRISSAVLEQIPKSFDPSQLLEESMEHLRQHGHEGSHTYLILLLYRAWNRCHQEDPSGGLIELLQCLSAAESKFGLGHLVTINCMSMVARAYERLNTPSVAKIHIDIALSRLKPCSKMLQSRYYQLSLSSAQILLAEGQLPEAREKLEHIVRFRREHLGVQAPMTWEAAEILFDTMRLQGFGLEAQHRRAELKACYDEEWKRHPLRFIPQQ